MSAGRPGPRPASSRPRLRICLDADALFAGAASATGASHLILQLGELGIIEVGVPAQARAEAERNLAAKLPAALPALRALLEACCIGLPMASDAESVAIAESDPILGSALAAGCGWLVTFNLCDYRSDRIRISNPGDFVEALRGELLLLGR